MRYDETFKMCLKVDNQKNSKRNLINNDSKLINFEEKRDIYEILLIAGLN